MTDVSHPEPSDEPAPGRRDDPDAPGNYVAGEGADDENPPEPNEPG